MAQIFILGSSNVYGVGGEGGGWADLVKQEFHTRMFSKYGTGETYEVYNFGKSGATVDVVTRTLPFLIKEYGNSHTIIAVVSVGGNDSKAVDRPENYFSSPEKYRKSCKDMFETLKKYSQHTFVVNGTGFYNEAKTNPFISPSTGTKIYFTNTRKKLFDDVLLPLCTQFGFPYIDPGVNEAEWIKTYSYRDGLHPNSEGHKLICRKVMRKLNEVI